MAENAVCKLVTLRSKRNIFSPNPSWRQAHSPFARINGLLTRWRNKLAGDAGAKVAFQMVEILGANPFVTARGVERRLGIAYNTVMRAIGQLGKQGIIKEVSGAKRDRVYCARKLLDILEEPAQLKPAKKF